MKLPPLSQAALAHQQKLLHYLKHSPQPLSFADFMNIVLYAPGLGYYSAGLHKLGAQGDFVTAPEISSLFSHCLADFCIPLLAQLKEKVIFELGAGSGRMANDILNFLHQHHYLPKHYLILEISADLRQRQQTYLQQHCAAFDRIVWLDTLPTLESAIVLANEVLDAMPVHLFQIGEHQTILEGQVKGEDEYHCEFGKPFSPRLVESVQALQPFDTFNVGYTSEINLNLGPWLHSLSHSLQQGVFLFLDYGFPQHEYYHPSRTMGTLMCHYQHLAHPDPFQQIGLQDITAHVDFSAVALAAQRCQLALAGFNTQAAFLLDHGLLDKVTKSMLPWSQSIQSLIQPQEMGELFKAIAFTKNFSHPLTGFSRDHSHRL